jgi:uncharacterized protein (UPF0261 family)
MKKTIAIIGTLDTKGPDFAFLKAEIEKRGCATLMIDTAILDDPYFTPDISREQVAEAGGKPLSALIAARDRGEAIAVMTKGVAEVVRRLYAEKRIDGIISMGGSGGTVIGTSGMRALPVGFPKVMVSTVAAGDVSTYVGTTDITIMPSVVDVAGVNSISRRIYTNAAGAICGMVMSEVKVGIDKPLVAASMFGNTTRAVNHARELLEQAGYEVLVFHATGTGGKTMEALIDAGFIRGVLDITTTEWADEICGGVLSAGPERLEAAARRGIPQVVVPGCIDMCNFWAPDTIPPKFKDRKFYQWNPNITLMRTTPEENARMGEIFAQKLNAASGPVVVMIPMGGWSELDLPGKPFYWPDANAAFISTLKAKLRPDIPIIEMVEDINDPAFSSRAVQTLLEMLRAKETVREENL